MEDEQIKILLESSERYPLPQGIKLSYGTAGFRADGSLLQSTVYRMGILAALRSIKTKSAVGLMITASHNQVSDNGVKIADSDGGMLTQEWEPFSDELANAPSSQDLFSLIVKFVEREDIQVGTVKGEVLLGRDTRPSGEYLLEAAKEGINSILGTTMHDMGILTTPQLHWMVKAKNKGLKATETDYYEQLSSSFRSLIELVPIGTDSSKVDSKLVVDAANGVGGLKLQMLKNKLNSLIVEVRNTGREGGVLNKMVGADYVQKEKVTPLGFTSSDARLRCASLDGDADRLVYFSVQPESKNQIMLLDGDKILSLFALFIKQQLSILKEADKTTSNYEVHLGVIQTAYANGASTAYLRQLGLEVVFARTGVKYLHKKATKYDIGIYFEANGHGTILFSEKFLLWLKAKQIELASSPGSEQSKAVWRISAVTKLINQAVGDALSGLLLVEAILQHMNWSIQNWNEIYADLPSRQLKVKVADRTMIVTTDEETQVLMPNGIQIAIDGEAAKYAHGRAFIRPSGTEDVVRIYAEASTKEEADKLANSVAELVDECLGCGYCKVKGTSPPTE